MGMSAYALDDIAYERQRVIRQGLCPVHPGFRRKMAPSGLKLAYGQETSQIAQQRGFTRATASMQNHADANWWRDVG